MTTVDSNASKPRVGPTAASNAPVIGRALLEVTHRLRGSRTLSILDEIRDAPFESNDAVLANQFSRLSRLLAHAESRVPYYRELFRSLGITSRDVRSLADFAQLPILTKDIIRERKRDLIRDDVRIEDLQTHHSGGSTGVPLTFHRERAYMDASEAGTYRNLMQCGWQPGEMVAFFWGGNPKIDAMQRWEFELRQMLRRMYLLDPFHSGPADMKRWLDNWDRIGASVALGYASTIARFAEFIVTSGAKLRPLRGVFTTAEKLFPQQRATMERAFGCPVFDVYGSSEVQNIAAECSQGRMHVNSDFVVLETDPSSNDPTAQPFLVTSLWNYAMPFIRYRNEDCGALADGACTCGSNFPLMTLNIARVSDNFTLPSGRVVHGEYFTHMMYGTRGIATFQFHQTARNAITLWIVPTEAAGDAQPRADAIRAAVKELQALDPGHDIAVEVREVPTIQLSTAGKHRFTRSDVR